MTKQIDKLMVLADNYADWVEYAESRQALQSALEAALKPGHEADVWHEGSQSFYRAKLLCKLTPEEVDVAPPAQTPNGLFVDLIAQHPGLAEELKAIDDTPMPTWTPPPRLSDEQIGMLTVFDGLHHVEVPLLAAYARAVETAVRKQFGVE
jgi:hypothetical protein